MLQREGVHLVVGLDEALRGVHVVGEQGLGATGDELTEHRRQANDVVADLVELGVEGLALLGHGMLLDDEAATDDGQRTSAARWAGSPVMR